MQSSPVTFSLQILIPDLARVSSDAAKQMQQDLSFKHSTNSGQIKQVLLAAL